MTANPNAPVAASATSDKVLIHPSAALSEAKFDKEIDHHRRLMLAQRVYELTQLTEQQAKIIAELEAKLAGTPKATKKPGDA